MRFFKAKEIDFKPLIVWHSVANSFEELEALELENDPLILPETELPIPMYGVCPLKIVAGELENRSLSEMNDFQDEWDIAEAMKANSNRLPSINENSFDYDGKTFPMDEVSRIFYFTIKETMGNHKIMTVTNELYNLNDSGTNIVDFYSAFILKLQDLSKHDI